MNTCGICRESLELEDTMVLEMKFLKTGRVEVAHLCKACLPRAVKSFEGDSGWSLSLESYLSYVLRSKELASL